MPELLEDVLVKIKADTSELGEGLQSGTQDVVAYVDSFKSSMGELSTAASESTAKIKDSFEKMVEDSVAAGSTLSDAIKGALEASAEATKPLEDGLKNVSATLVKGAEGLDAYRKSAEDMADALVVAASQSTGSLREMMTQAADDIRKALEDSAEGAKPLVEGLDSAGAAAGQAGEQFRLFDEALSIPFADASGQLNLFSTDLEEFGSAAKSSLGEFSEGAKELIQNQQELENTLTAAKEVLAEVQSAYEAGAVSAETLNRAQEEVEKAAAQAGVALEDEGEKAHAFGESVKQWLEHPIDSATSAITSFVEAVGPMGIAVIAGGAAVLELGHQLVDLVLEEGAAAEATRNLSYRLNIGFEDTKKLSEMSKIAGVSIEILSRTSMRLAQALENPTGSGKKVADALHDMKIETTDSGEAMLQLLQKLALIPDATERISKAHEIMGRGAVRLEPLLRNYEKLSAAVESLGGQLSEEMIQGLEDADDAADKLGIAWSHLKENIAAVLAPWVKSGIDAITDALAGMVPHIETAREHISKLRKEIIDLQKDVKEAKPDFSSMLAAGYTGGLSITQGDVGKQSLIDSKKEELRAATLLNDVMEEATAQSKEYNKIIDEGIALQKRVAAESAAAMKKMAEEYATFDKAAKAVWNSLPDEYDQYVKSLTEGGKTAKSALSQVTGELNKLDVMSQTFLGKPLAGVKSWIANMKEAKAVLIDFEERDELLGKVDTTIVDQRVAVIKTALANILADSKSNEADRVRATANALAKEIDLWEKAGISISDVNILASEKATAAWKAFSVNLKEAFSGLGIKSEAQLIVELGMAEAELKKIQDSVTAGTATSTDATNAEIAELAKKQAILGQLGKALSDVDAKQLAYLQTLKKIQAMSEDDAFGTFGMISPAKLKESIDTLNVAYEKVVARVGEFSDAAAKAWAAGLEKEVADTQKAGLQISDALASKLEAAQARVQLNAVNSVNALKALGVTSTQELGEIVNLVDAQVKAGLKGVESGSSQATTIALAGLQKIKAGYESAGQAVPKSVLDSIAALQTAIAKTLMTEEEAYKQLGVTSVKALEGQITLGTRALEIMRETGAPLAAQLEAEQRLLETEIELDIQYGRSATRHIVDLENARLKTEALIIASRKLGDIYVTISQHVSHLVQTLGGELVSAIAKAFDSSQNNRLSQTIAGLNKDLADHAKAWEKAQHDASAAIDGIQADLEASLAAELYDYNAFVADVSAKFGEIAAAHAKSQEQIRDDASRSLRDQATSYQRFVEDTNEKIAEAQAKGDAKTVAELQKQLRRRTEDYNTYVSDLNRATQKRLQDDQAAQAKETGDLRKQLAERAKAHEEADSQLVARAAEQTAAVQANLAEQKAAYDQYVADTTVQIHELEKQFTTAFQRIGDAFKSMLGNFALDLAKAIANIEVEAILKPLQAKIAAKLRSIVFPSVGSGESPSTGGGLPGGTNQTGKDVGSGEVSGDTAVLSAAVTALSAAVTAETAATQAQTTVTQSAIQASFKTTEENVAAGNVIKASMEKVESALITDEAMMAAQVAASATLAGALLANAAATSANVAATTAAATATTAQTLATEHAAIVTTYSADITGVNSSVVTANSAATATNTGATATQTGAQTANTGATTVNTTATGTQATAAGANTVTTGANTVATATNTAALGTSAASSGLGGILQGVGKVLGSSTFQGAAAAADVAINTWLLLIMRRVEQDIGRIEVTTRGILNEISNLRHDEWLREGHLFLKLDDIWNEIKNVAHLMLVSASQEIIAKARNGTLDSAQSDPLAYVSDSADDVITEFGGLTNSSQTLSRDFAHAADSMTRGVRTTVTSLQDLSDWVGNVKTQVPGASFNSTGDVLTDMRVQLAQLLKVKSSLDTTAPGYGGRANDVQKKIDELIDELSNTDLIEAMQKQMDAFQADIAALNKFGSALGGASEMFTSFADETFTTPMLSAGPAGSPTYYDGLPLTPATSEAKGIGQISYDEWKAKYDAEQADAKRNQEFQYTDALGHGFLTQLVDQLKGIGTPNYFSEIGFGQETFQQIVDHAIEAAQQGNYQTRQVLVAGKIPEEQSSSLQRGADAGFKALQDQYALLQSVQAKEIEARTSGFVAFTHAEVYALAQVTGTGQTLETAVNNLAVAIAKGPVVINDAFQKIINLTPPRFEAHGAPALPAPSTYSGALSYSYPQTPYPTAQTPLPASPFQLTATNPVSPETRLTVEVSDLSYRSVAAGLAGSLEEMNYKV